MEGYFLMLNNNIIQDKVLRCAIYTRKSTEKGLELEYNSLDFQYNRCMEYINSQPNLKFVKKYEDAGISGKNTQNRPAFLEMMRDVEARNIDCIIVYKLDRLSRSIVDLANLVEKLQNIDAHFISVTQQIDTSNSCGKLSFNMLAAIAQFEREIASERVRDKIVSAKTQGLWCGGSVPLGYKAENKRLEIVEESAKYVRYIFNEYIKGNSINSISKELQLKNVKTTKNKAITFDVVKNILKNPMYVGKVKLKGLLYDGVHKAIVDYNTWEKAQQLLESRVEENSLKVKKKYVSKSLLGGLIFCGDCNTALTPTHTTKGNILYRYYVCLNYTRGYNKSCQIKRISANQIEEVVKKEVFRLLTSESVIDDIVSQTSGFLPDEIKKCCQHIEDIWNLLLVVEKRKIILNIVNRVNVYTDKVEIEIKASGLEKVISEALKVDLQNINKGIFIIIVPINIIHSQKQIIQTRNDIYDIKEIKSSNSLIKKIALAVSWKELFEKGEYESLSELAEKEGIDYTTACRIFHLNYISPEIIDYIVNNPECGKNVSLRTLLRMKLPLLWQEQRDYLLPMLKGQLN